MTIAQAKANYKRITKQDAPAEWTLEDTLAEIEKAKAKNQEEARANAAEKYREALGNDPADDLTIEQIYAAIKSAGKAPKYKVNFAVDIPETGKKYSKEEIENDPEILEYLLSIGSPAVSKIEEN